jgi:hypothetical protein
MPPLAGIEPVLLAGCVENSVLVEAVLFKAANLFFGLKPVLDVRSRLTTSQDVEFIGSKLDAFFERERLDRRFC